MNVQVFDKPMCCSTGLCGPEVDPALVRFAGDLDWLKRQGVQVERYNLSQQPREFAQQDDVRTALQTQGVEVLPIIRVDGRIVGQGAYPSRRQLADWANVADQAGPTDLPIVGQPSCQPGGGCC